MTTATAAGETLLEVRGLNKTYRAAGREPVVALSDVYLRVPKGEITCLVGESGSGKSTTVRCLLGLERPDSGWMEYAGTTLDFGTRGLGRVYHRRIQVVFQDPTASLNPRMTAGDLIGEGLTVHGLASTKGERAQRVAELMTMVGLDPATSGRRPGSFSGGQRQRIAIARALAVEPQLLICDEAVSALDVSVQAQILNLLMDMRDRLDLTVLFIAHDLAVVHQIASQVVVLQGGRVVEEGPCDRIFADPQHEYTRALLAAVPIPEPATSRARAAQRRVEADQLTAAAL